jgi:hypothetical protein
MEAIRSELDRLKQLETQLSSQAPWANDSSPRSLVDSALIQRYEEARDLYLQRRLENLLVDHIATYQPDEEDEPFEFPHVDDEEEAQALEGRHAKALAKLQTSLDLIQEQVTKLKATKEAVAARRQELEHMIQDMEGVQVEMEEDDETMDDDNDTVDDAAMAAEQERIEQLQQRKARLQEELAKIQKETKEAQERALHKHEQLALLQEPQEDLAAQQQKIEELREMKLFYDSLREVLEELGGVKILQVEEDSIKRNLILTLSFYETYDVMVELEVYRKVFLKVVHARWISEPLVYPMAESANEETTVEEDKKKDFFLTMDPLDDLVRVAKTTLGPPHDIRFVVRETLARIRIAQERVEELEILRRHVLTKVHGGNQVVCSLNEGIVIIIRLYERFIRLDQIVGVGGWDEQTTKSIQAAVSERLEKEYPQDDAEILVFGSKVTPLMIVQYVQNELMALQASQGIHHPRTPRFPERKKEGF